jgi:hypothetical protein
MVTLWMAKSTVWFVLLRWVERRVLCRDGVPEQGSSAVAGPAARISIAVRVWMVLSVVLDSSNRHWSLRLN